MSGLDSPNQRETAMILCGAGATQMKVETDRDRAEYWRARQWLDGAMHELPAGVLDGMGGADASACGDMLRGLDEFAALCTRLGLKGHEAYIESCGWHLDHYPHYLGRRRHFADYESYTRDRNGPLRVAAPPELPSWLQQQT